MRSLAVIGAGAAGLCAAKHACESFKVVVYEMADVLGGTWVYESSHRQHTNPVASHSSMYESLITNLPKQVIQFPDFDFDHRLPSFISHEIILDYLQRYTKNFQLLKCIKFNHKVQEVVPVDSQRHDGLDDVKWEVSVKNLLDDRVSWNLFDAVLVCNGHYSLPYTPTHHGTAYFKGLDMHSHNYKRPDQFKGEDVLIVGAGASGIDIALDVAQVAHIVYVSHKRSRLLSTLPVNVLEVPEVKGFSKDGTSVIFTDGDMKPISSVVYCTGYKYNFPFLDESCGIKVADNRITHLFKHIVNINHPSMMFIGVPAQIPPFRVFDLQASYVCGVFSGRVSLPTKTDMLCDEGKDFKERLDSGLVPNHAHVMTGRVAQYVDNLSDIGGIKNIPDNIKALYLSVLEHRSRNICSYKNDNYFLNSVGKYVVEAK